MSKWFLDNEAWLKKQMRRSIVARVLVKILLAVAIAAAEVDEQKARRAT